MKIREFEGAYFLMHKMLPLIYNIDIVECVPFCLKDVMYEGH